MNRVFVDFENVPNVDLALISGRPAEVTLLLGEKQRRLDLELVHQIHDHAQQVSLVEVGGSGRNALDLVLAWHLGQAAERHPKDMFFVVSRDKDFDPLIKHLRARGLEVARVDSFASLPFLGTRDADRRGPSGRSRPPAGVSKDTTTREPRPRQASAAATSAATSSTAADPRLAKLIDRLRHKPKARPVRKKTLLSHINGFYGNGLTASELEEKVETLRQGGIIAIEANGRVTYP